MTQCGESHSQSFSCVCINEFSIIKLCIFHSLISFHFFLFFFLFLCVYHVRLGFLCSNVENVFFLIQPRASRASNSHTHTHVFLVCIRNNFWGVDETEVQSPNLVPRQRVFGRVFLQASNQNVLWNCNELICLDSNQPAVECPH